ncbi:MetQ/NlpA family ABC transporter substrate-binding protein [Sporolactobacillus terrae]|uniref:Lipoprotein n=1 Tax=Sporolactobacillus terrae TaxID=269673 RepID=A0A410D7M6_9BACL|nr:MetQ/NlpA family ABC transporter substrate-binding protein [Sporolactobacillus terrae]QAA22086.1 methionine ABC transporter substrate-binding protein [Sporolactobacillus terrae]QAA25058.1 methionine ABC transporter substrate-binding protein [Sporolactobacillus terrae]UAK16881.1 MetQ/NlpA family ABC transporter substrate-binding protein [Sporolactobacillus terrae]BBN98378.1 lipoprotein [Sporolactobacillus terrae]
MKKSIVFSLVLAFALILSACAQSAGSSQKTQTLTVGASAVPHAQILKQAVPLLKKKGINLKVKVFQDYVLPNQALASKQLDANYFQHVPFLDLYNKQHNTDLVNAGKIHIEPFGIYSNKYKKIADIKDGATVQISNNKSEQGRILLLLQSKGLLKIKSGVDPISATLKDINNFKHLKFLQPIDPALLPKAYENSVADLFAINTNFALQANLQPKKDALILEGASSPYANIIAVRKGDQNKKAIKELVHVLQSKEIQSFINKKYKGAVLPVSE